MARKVTSMKVIAAVTAFVAGEPVNVARTCREAGVSRKTFYKWAARYRVDGLAGFEERSRRPRVTPSRTPDDVESLIVALRARLLEAGLDHGARSVQWHLGREPAMRGRRVPAAATVHRVLVRHGVVEPQPRKRPTSSWRRFEAPAPNEWWQIDAMDWVIATGPVSVFNIIDDHSRVAARSRAVTHATTAEAWTTFCQAAQQWGLPAGVLSDNGLCFSGKLRQFEVAFEANLRDAGIRPITGRPFHPQTTGKVERFQQTLKKWLRRQPLAGTIENSKPSSTGSATSTTTNAHTKASAVPPQRADGTPHPDHGPRASHSNTPCSNAPSCAPHESTQPATSDSTAPSASGSASPTPAPTPPSSSTTTTQRCSSTTNSSATSASTTPATTNPPANAAAALANAA
jgi:transposase InsO family protein